MLSKALIFVLVFSVVVMLIGFLPTINIDPTAVVTSSAYAYIRAGCYFLPMQTVVTIISLVLALWLFRLIVAIIKALWDILPVA